MELFRSRRDGHGAAAAGGVQAGGAVRVAGVRVGAQPDQPADAQQVPRAGEEQQKPVHLVEFVERLAEDGARAVAGGGVEELRLHAVPV